MQKFVKSVISIVALAPALFFVAPASAEIVYGTSIEGANLFRYDTTTNVVTTVTNLGLIGRMADSMVFDNSGRIIYSSIYTGEVRRFDPTSNTDTLLANGLNNPADLLLEPGGNSVLVSEYSGGKIDRINLTTNAVTTLGNYGGNPEGLAYDSAGRLYANLGCRECGSTGKYIAELNPTTGAVIRTSGGLNSLDGLTFDSVTGKLFASSLYGNGLYAVDTGTLAATAIKFGSISLPDGIASDNAGNLFLASRGNFTIYEYNIASDTLSPLKYIYGLDDLAPVAGLGAASVPEPFTLSLLGLGLAGLGFAKRRKQKTV